LSKGKSIEIIRYYNHVPSGINVKNKKTAIVPFSKFLRKIEVTISPEIDIVKRTGYKVRSSIEQFVEFIREERLIYYSHNTG